MKNSLFASNTGGNTNGKPDSLGYNLSTDASGGFTAVGDRSSVAAGVLALADNGGFVRTHALAAGNEKGVLGTRAGGCWSVEARST